MLQDEMDTTRIKAEINKATGEFKDFGIEKKT